MEGRWPSSLTTAPDSRTQSKKKGSSEATEESADSVPSVSKKARQFAHREDLRLFVTRLVYADLCLLAFHLIIDSIRHLQEKKEKKEKEKGGFEQLPLEAEGIQPDGDFDPRCTFVEGRCPELPLLVSDMHLPKGD
jgi:hypothetical protein